MFRRRHCIFCPKKNRTESLHAKNEVKKQHPGAVFHSVCSPPASLRARDKGSLPQSGPLHPPFPILSPVSSLLLASSVFFSHNCILQKSPETPHPPCSAHSAVALLQNPRLSWRLPFYVPAICILEK